MSVIRIISGGQTGADQGALVAAKQLGIETGGWMPNGFLTEAGPCPTLKEVYGMREHKSPYYPARTKANVRDSDGTIWVGKTGSRGYRCTLNAADAFEKPFLVVTSPAMIQRFIDTYNIKILNVAGNRESTNKGIHRATAELLLGALR